MNVIQNVNELGLTGLTSEYKRASDNITQSNEVGEHVNEVTAGDQQVNTIPSPTTEYTAHQPLTAEQLDKVAQQLQDFVGDLNRNIEFSVDKDSGRDVIKVIDKDSGDLLKQYPSEEVLTLVSKLSDMVGGFIDAKV